jgi:hypothetical protein
MFNDFNLSIKEIEKILKDYNPLIVNMSVLNGAVDEDLMQEIKLVIFRNLTKNKKSF